MTNPQALPMPFAWNGTRNSIPNTPVSDASNKANIETGFPPITSEPLSSGGIPPERADMNAVGYLSTAYSYFLQNGGVETFRPEVAAAIGGYPLNARLWGVDENGNAFRVRSAKANNSDNFVSTPSFIGTSWIVELSMSSQARYAIGTWRNSDASMWWVKYSDGFCEQGGWAYLNAASYVQRNIPLLVPISVATFLTITQTQCNRNDESNANPAIRIENVNGVQNAMLNIGWLYPSQNIFWKVEGYMA